MKKIILITVSFILLVGCHKKEQNLLECTKEEMQNDNKVINTVMTTYNKSNIQKLEIKTETILAEKYLEYIDTFETEIRNSFNNYMDKKGITINTTKTSSSIILDMIIDASLLDDDMKKSLGIMDTYSSYDKAKNMMIQDGYTCK